jgi:hypothetical protein
MNTHGICYAMQCIKAKTAMRVFFFWTLLLLLTSNTGFGQIPSRGGGAAIVKIPVVVHILYNQSITNVPSDEQVAAQIRVLNQCFRRTSPDTVNTPAIFKGLAADCEIEFQLATSDPIRRVTSGIIRKYTPVSSWLSDDKMKSSANGGDDGWDPKQYLNIWVCNIRFVAGYSSVPGDVASKDGVVLSFGAFGLNSGSGREMGKTAVHEVGHWLGLKHIWGDEYCGDDGIADTPKQGNFTSGCPTGVRSTCGAGAGGDMYMNYMDLTSDACTNLFTLGQKAVMHSHFAVGGARNSLLTSKGGAPPLINEIPVAEDLPKFYQPHIYPNPASDKLFVDLAYDMRWIGKTITITNAQGQIIRQEVITGKLHQVDVASLKPGLYLIYSKKEDGAVIRDKFLKR